MGFRFYRRINLGKFLRLNISKSGIGVSVGMPGLRVSTGPHGTHFYAGIPGTGLSYRKKLNRSTPTDYISDGSEAQAEEETSSPPEEPPSPGFFAPREEKELAEGLEQYYADNDKEALDHFLNVASEEPSAAVLAAVLLAEQPGGAPQAIKMLERVIESDDEFPTPLMEKYLSSVEIDIDITPRISASIPISGLATTLLLAELYESQGRLDEAIGLLEELDELVDDPLLTLSLCELYAMRGLWDGIIDRAKHTQNEDNVTLATLFFYGRAMQGKELHEAAIKVFTEALRKKKDRDQELLNEVRYWRALSYEAVGKRSRANQEFQKLFAEAPDFRDVAERLEKWVQR